MSDALNSTPIVEEAPPALHLPLRRYLDLFLISFLSLFLELACIRWFGSTVVFLTFFTNIVLMACFLGLSVGCLAAGRTLDFGRFVLPLLLLAAGLGIGVLWTYNHFGQLTIQVERLDAPQQVYFGTERRPVDPAHFVVPIELVAALFFTLIALIFVGLGQMLGRAFDAIPGRVQAYTMNVLGSLVGIGAFAGAAQLRTGPLVWFGVSIALVFYLLNRRTMWQALSGVALMSVLFGNMLTDNETGTAIWSPYSKVQYDPTRRMIDVNNIGHQGMVQLQESGPGYPLPYLLARAVGQPPFRDVMIIGAGSGNDVSAALAFGSGHVDAVEIDPVLYETGRARHPNRPYSDSRVSVHLDDGRSYVRKTSKKYDLVLYAVVDSLVLHSGYSSLRLENFLFTEQALRDIQAKLKPGGVFAMYNYYRHGWVVGRLKVLAERVFGTEPLVISLPYHEAIGSDDRGMYLTCLLVGNRDATMIEALRREFQAGRFFWGHKYLAYSALPNGFRTSPPHVLGTEPKEWEKIAPGKVDTSAIHLLPTDDWPFLYVRERSIPGLNLRGMALVALLSLAILCAFAPVRSLRPSGRMFFLGAGFMLLETKGVVHMALLFGSTWIVNSIVFAAVLVMILLSNLFVLTVQPKRLWPFYALLFASLLFAAIVPMDTFLALPGTAKIVSSCAVTFVPIFFAGIIFASAFRQSTRPDIDLGSNIGGVVLGGLSENASLLVGFNALLFVAIGYYALSALFGARARG
jgi:SAM-dependent methyltransferase